MKRAWRLTTSDIVNHPELTSLAMLDSVLQHAVLAITTANPELILEKKVALKGRPQAGLIDRSCALIKQFRDLQSALMCYRKEVTTYGPEDSIPF